jgi:hypothetical protein
VSQASSRVARAYGVANLVAAAVVLFGVFVALPARWWPVDAGALVVGALLAASGVGLVTKKPWADRAARGAAALVLAIGLAFIATLALTASYLSGIYGPVGRGGAIILALVAALTLPYLVVLPAAQLVWLGPRGAK